MTKLNIPVYRLGNSQGEREIEKYSALFNSFQEPNSQAKLRLRGIICLISRLTSHPLSLQPASPSLLKEQKTEGLGGISMFQQSIRSVTTISGNKLAQ
ncbi:hypothetical protein J6590_034164 [Homalodisca vitripennis]|nr:hypothetical protein J6590_034164 [Homalodisca vitripennis]